MIKQLFVLASLRFLFPSFDVVRVFRIKLDGAIDYFARVVHYEIEALGVGPLLQIFSRTALQDCRGSEFYIVGVLPKLMVRSQAHDCIPSRRVFPKLHKVVFANFEYRASL